MERHLLRAGPKVDASWTANIVARMNGQTVYNAMQPVSITPSKGLTCVSCSIWEAGVGKAEGTEPLKRNRSPCSLDTLLISKKQHLLPE